MRSIEGCLNPAWDLQQECSGLVAWVSHPFSDIHWNLMQIPFKRFKTNQVIYTFQVIDVPLRKNIIHLHSCLCCFNKDIIVDSQQWLLSEKTEYRWITLH